MRNKLRKAIQMILERMSEEKFRTPIVQVGEHTLFVESDEPILFSQRKELQGILLSSAKLNYGLVRWL